MRNVISTAALPLTMGTSALAYGRGKWHCPTCGGPVYDKAAKERAEHLNEALTKSGRYCWRHFKAQPTWAKVAQGGTLLLLLAMPS